MLASAAGRFKDRQIYATGGNDNSVGIWDLTEFFMTQEELPPISNGTSDETYDEYMLIRHRRDGQQPGQVCFFQNGLSKP